MENSVFLISFNYFNQVGFPLYIDHSSLRSPSVFPILDIIALYCGQQILIKFLLVISGNRNFFYPILRRIWL